MMNKRKAIVYISLKAGVLDPQGLTIHKAMINMGFRSISSVRSGKFYELEISVEDGKAEAEIGEICKKLLANPIIENFNVEYK
jgi:phosphoribosylformylglycinamidine synthase PurS subunit